MIARKERRQTEGMIPLSFYKSNHGHAYFLKTASRNHDSVLIIWNYP